MNKTNIETLGFTQKFKVESTKYEGRYIERIFSQYKDQYKIMYESGELMAEVSGEFRFEAKSPSDFPLNGC